MNKNGLLGMILEAAGFEIKEDEKEVALIGLVLIVLGLIL